MPHLVIIDGPAAPANFRYLAMETTLPSGNFRVRELAWRAGGVWYPTVGMTNFSAPAPLVVVASSYNSYQPWKAYDLVVNLSSTGSHWLTNNTGNKQIVLDLGDGNGIAPDAFRIMCYHPSAQGIEEFSCYGSNDPNIMTIANWASAQKTLLGTFAPGLVGWTAGVYREFPFP